MNYSTEVAKSIRILSEMLGDRGIDASALENFSPTEFSNSTVFSIDVNPEVKVICDVTNKFKWAEIKKTLDIDTENLGDLKLIILIVNSQLNNAEQKKLEADLKVDYQIFQLRELQFNISHHRLVPKHELMTDEAEITKVLDRYQVKKNQLPLILKSDPMARYLNAKVGNLIKVTRVSPTCGENIVYRSVV